MRIYFVAPCNLTLSAVLVALLPTVQAQAQTLTAPKRVAIQGVKQTPLAHCMAGTIKFVRHTRKALKFEGKRYCTDRDWDVTNVEHDGSRVYWRVPFADAKAGERNPYGKGDVLCECRKK